MIIKVPKCPECGTEDQIGQNVIGFREILEWEDEKPTKFGDVDTNGTPIRPEEFYCLICGTEFDKPEFEEREI